MSNNLLEITPGEGLGSIKFGMTREQIQTMLGEPDEKESYTHDEQGEDITESWHYDDKEISVSFEKVEGWKLCTIAVSDPACTLDGHNIIGMTREELEDVLEDMGITELIEDDWSTDETPDYISLTCEDQEIVFWIEEGIVMDVQWGPFFIDEDTIRWPLNGAH
jgi:hypothetical protein